MEDYQFNFISGLLFGILGQISESDTPLFSILFFGMAIVLMICCLIEIFGKFKNNKKGGKPKVI